MPGGGATGASAAGVPLTGIRSGGWFGSFLVASSPKYLRYDPSFRRQK
jgi:hypothetical protein